MRIDGSAVRAGMVIEWNGKLYVVVKHEIRTPGNLRAFNQVELKDVMTGTKQNPRFSSGEAIERVQLDEKEYNYLYADGDMLTFMDNETYEQISMDKGFIGEQIAFLQDGMTVSMQTYEGRPISIKLPEKVVCEIVETEPVMKGQTAASSYKPATLDNGLRITVPPFVATGEKVVVNTQDIAYVERAK
jgi:elongation factor P